MNASLGIASARGDVLDLVGVGEVQPHLFCSRAGHALVVPPLVSSDAGAAGREGGPFIADWNLLCLANHYTYT